VLKDIGVGLGAAAVTVAVALLLPSAARVPLLGVALGVAAGVYPGFAHGGTSVRERGIQWVVTAAFALVATVGIAFNAWWIAIGWVLHAAWDGLHHAGRRGAWVPAHYPMFCLTFDLALAIYAGFLASGSAA